MRRVHRRGRRRAPRGIDILYNNAGLALGRYPFWESNEEDEATVIHTNIDGAIRMTRLCLPFIRDEGHILFCGSIAGRQAYENAASYVAAKFGVRGFVYALREDLLGRPIRITTVDAGLTETEFSLVRFKGDATKASAVYDGVEPMRAEDIAECVLFALTRPAHVNVDEIVVKATAQSSAVASSGARRWLMPRSPASGCAIWRVWALRRRAGGFAASAATYASRRPSVTDATSIGDGLAPRLQSVQLAPRHRRSRGINHLVTSVARSSLRVRSPYDREIVGLALPALGRWRRSRSTSSLTRRSSVTSAARSWPPRCRGGRADRRFRDLQLPAVRDDGSGRAGARGGEGCHGGRARRPGALALRELRRPGRCRPIAAFAGPLADLIGADGETHALAVTYLRIASIGLAFAFLALGGSGYLHWRCRSAPAAPDRDLEASRMSCWRSCSSTASTGGSRARRGGRSSRRSRWARRSSS